MPPRRSVRSTVPQPNTLVNGSASESKALRSRNDGNSDSVQMTRLLVGHAIARASEAHRHSPEADLDLVRSAASTGDDGSPRLLMLHSVDHAIARASGTHQSSPEADREPNATAVAMGDRTTTKLLVQLSVGHAIGRASEAHPQALEADLSLERGAAARNNDDDSRDNANRVSRLLCGLSIRRRLDIQSQPQQSQGKFTDQGTLTARSLEAQRHQEAEREASRARYTASDAQRGQEPSQCEVQTRTSRVKGAAQLRREQIQLKGEPAAQEARLRSQDAQRKKQEGMSFGLHIIGSILSSAGQKRQEQEETEMHLAETRSKSQDAERQKREGMSVGLHIIGSVLETADRICQDQAMAESHMAEQRAQEQRQIDSRRRRAADLAAAHNAGRKRLVYDAKCETVRITHLLIDHTIRQAAWAREADLARLESLRKAAKLEQVRAFEAELFSIGKEVDYNEDRRRRGLRPQRFAPRAGTTPRRTLWRSLTNSTGGLAISRFRKRYYPSDVPESLIHLLPGELRNYLYRMLDPFTEDIGGHHQLGPVSEPALAAAFPSLAPELYTWFSWRHTFDVPVYSKFLSAMKIQRLHPNPHLMDDTYRCGKLAIDTRHWLRGMGGLSFLRFRKVRLQIRECDDTEVCTATLIGGSLRRKDQEACGLHMSPLAQNIKARLCLAIGEARRVVAILLERPGFDGFTMQDLDAVAGAFRNPDHLVGQAAEGKYMRYGLASSALQLASL